MKRNNLAIQLAASLLAAAAVPAYAQSSVTLYGIINDGMAYGNNQGGHSSIYNISGNLRGDRLDFAGVEDLGGGYKAVFLLENGFGLNNGGLQQGGRMFGRQSYVGLGTPAGTVTMGRQYDFMLDMGRFSAGSYTGFGWRPQTATLLTGNNGSTIDTDRLGGARVDNSVKYVSPSYNGLSFGGLYGLDQGSSSGTTAGHTLSLTSKYLNGPFAAEATFTSLTDPTGGMTVAEGGVGSGAYQNYALGASYDFGRVVLGGLLTEDRWTADEDRTLSFEVDAKYQLTAQWQLGAGFFHIVPNHDATNIILRGVRNQVTWIADYFLSKRTDVYFTGAFQTAGNGQDAFIYDAPSASSTNRQVEIEFGMRHVF
jgi:predicted porin